MSHLKSINIRVTQELIERLKTKLVEYNANTHAGLTMSQFVRMVLDQYKVSEGEPSSDRV